MTNFLSSEKTLAAILLSVAITSPASAGTILVDVIDDTTISYALSGTLDADPGTTAAGNLLIDIPDIFGNSFAVSFSGSAFVDGNLLDSSFIGFDNAFVGQSIQLRSGPNGDNGFEAGDVMSGMTTVTYGSAHGLDQSVFDGNGVPFFFPNGAGGELGRAVSAATAVPLPATGLLLVMGIGGLAVFRRTRG